VFDRCVQVAKARVGCCMKEKESDAVEKSQVMTKHNECQDDGVHHRHLSILDCKVSHGLLRCVGLIGLAAQDVQDPWEIVHQRNTECIQDY
jgi:hypothetical protein